MRLSFLEKLKCPKCKSSAFNVVATTEGNYALSDGSTEIRFGTIQCIKCSTGFNITDGVVNFMYEPDNRILSQQEIICEADKDADSEGIGFEITPENVAKYKSQFLSLPEGDGSDLYRKGAFRGVANLSKQYRAFLTAMNLSGREKILELGADSCWSTKEFALLGCDCVALDINHHLIVSDLYMSENKIFFERVKADMNVLPFKDGEFDVVFCSQSAHHSLDVSSLMREISRVIKRGGRLALFSEPSLGLIFIWQKIFFGRQARKLGLAENIYTLSEWIKYLRGAGFYPELYFSFYPRKDFTKRWFSLFASRIVINLLLRFLIYPHLILKPYNVDIIAYKLGSNVSLPKERRVNFI